MISLKKYCFSILIILFFFNVTAFAEEDLIGNNPNYRSRTITVELVNSDPNDSNLISFKDADRKTGETVFLVNRKTTKIRETSNLGLDDIKNGLKVMVWVPANLETGELIDKNPLEVHTIFLTTLLDSVKGYNDNWKPEVIFSDIAYGTDYYNISSVLSKLNIMKGYPDGQFKPDHMITKSEMVKIILSLKKMQDTKPTATPKELFSDVGEEYWAYDNIYAAKEVGLIEGNGDDTFSPEDNITYEQAVKMIISLLGYASMADANGGYSNGYLIVAEQTGLTKELSFQSRQPMNRGETAKLVYNALNIPLRLQTGFGDKIEYEIFNGNGTSGTIKTLNTEYFSE